MSSLSQEVLAEKVSAVERHLARVHRMLPPAGEVLLPATNASDAVILHLWQATQIVIDLATKACVTFTLGTPASYADAFERLGKAGFLDRNLVQRLRKAAGFRNVVAHAYDDLDMQRVRDAAENGPADLRACLAALRDAAHPSS